mgnify:CR=1 FL=1
MERVLEKIVAASRRELALRKTAVPAANSSSAARRNSDSVSSGSEKFTPLCPLT